MVLLDVPLCFSLSLALVRGRLSWSTEALAIQKGQLVTVLAPGAVFLAVLLIGVQSPERSSDYAGNSFLPAQIHGATSSQYLCV